MLFVVCLFVWIQLTMARYSMFYPLYPIGIGAEWWLLYRAIEPGARISWVIPPVFYFCLMLYVPGKYISTMLFFFGFGIRC